MKFNERPAEEMNGILWGFYRRWEFSYKL